MIQQKRHIAKTITYRLLSSTLSLLVIKIMTNSWALGATFSIMELIIKPLTYYLHERAWYKWIKFGVKKDNAND